MERLAERLRLVKSLLNTLLATYSFAIIQGLSFLEDRASSPIVNNQPLWGR